MFGQGLLLYRYKELQHESDTGIRYLYKEIWPQIVIVDTHLRTNTNGKKGSLCATKEKKPTKGEIKADHDNQCEHSWPRYAQMSTNSPNALQIAA